MLNKLEDFLNQDPKRAEDYRDFQRRAEERPEDISDAEAARRYRELMAHAGDEDDREMEQQYEQAFGKLSPEERRAVAERYREATHNDSRAYDGYRQDQDLEQASSPKELGRMTRRAAQKDPDLIDQVFGPNSPVSGTAGRMALAGLAAFAAKRFLGKR